MSTPKQFLIGVAVAMGALTLTACGGEAAAGGTTYSVPCHLPDGTEVVLTDYHQGWEYRDGIDCMSHLVGPNPKVNGVEATFGTPESFQFYAFTVCADVDPDALYGRYGVGSLDGPTKGQMTESHVTEIRDALRMCPDHPTASTWQTWLDR